MSSTRTELLTNFTSLSSVQITNYILPLITFPYLVRVLGPERFGLITFVQAFNYYFIFITDYGFNLSATREISISRENTGKVSDIFSTVMVIKIAILLISLSLLTSIVFSVARFRKEAVVFFFTFLQLPAMVLFPFWLFQGMEKLKIVAILNLIPRLFFTIMIFLVVKQESDYIFVPLLTSVGSLIAGFAAFFIGIHIFSLSLRFPSTDMIWHELKEGWHFFVSTLAISLYTFSNPFILGLLVNTTAVGYYSAADKIVRALQQILMAFSQTVYPHVSKIAAESKQNALRFIHKITILAGSITLGIAVILFFGAEPICMFVLGNEFRESILLLRVMAILPFVFAMGNIFSVQGLYAFGFQSVVSRFILKIAVFHLGSTAILTWLYSYNGTAVASLVCELLIGMFSIYYFRKNITSFFKSNMEDA
jgi:PST family polysaccharide transporter